MHGGEGQPPVAHCAGVRSDLDGGRSRRSVRDAAASVSAVRQNSEQARGLEERIARTRAMILRTKFRGGPFDGLEGERLITEALGDEVKIPIEHEPGAIAVYRRYQRSVGCLPVDDYEYDHIEHPAAH